MKLKDVSDMITGGGVYCSRWKIPADRPLPFATLTKPRKGESFSADNNGNYYATMHCRLYLALDVDDEETEYIVDGIFEKNKINFTYEMKYLSEDNLCCKIYDFEVKEN